MSTILKALRRLENSNHPLGEGRLDLESEILKHKPEEPLRSSWPKPLIGALLLCFAAGGGWLYLRTAEQGSGVDLAFSNLQSATVPLHLEANRGQRQAESSAAINGSPPTISEKTSVAASQTGSPRAGFADLSTVTETAALVIPALSIDEIIYNRQQKVRMAVINGLPAMEGTDVEGVHIETIMADYVSFSYRGIRFNKFLSRPNE